MAKQPAKNLNITISGVSLEDDFDDVTLNIEQETPIVTAFSDTGPRRVVGNYDVNVEARGNGDFAAAQVDATIFALLNAAAAQAVTIDPTGNVAGANDPNYDMTDMLLSRYTIAARVGDAIKVACTLLGNSAIARAVA